MDPVHLPELFPRDVLARLRELVEIDPDVCVRDFTEPGHGASLAAAEVLITGWGCPPIDEAALAAMPRLRAVLHTGGSVRYFITPACWERGLVVSTAAEANAAPVAEFAFAAILFAAKDAFGTRERYRLARRHPSRDSTAHVGAFGARVGLVGASRVGRRTLELLRMTDLEVALSDPYLDDASAAALGARLLSLDELLSSSRVVSLHAPQLPATHHLLDARRLALIPDGGVLVNTARGTLVDEDALIAELSSGRISAVLDVTTVEPPAADSPLYRLPNVFLTPHVAGSLGNECARLGGSVVDELIRHRDGLPLLHQVTETDLDRIA